jgi:cyclase
MLKIRIIPTILFDNFKLIKGVHFESWRTVGSIMQAVKIYNLREVDELIVLDISATNNKKKIDLELINEIANETFMPLTVGGGVKSIKDVSNLLEAGADKVSINTASFENENLMKECSKTFGSQCIVGSIDYKMVNQDIIVYSNSGTIRQKVNFYDHVKKIEDSGVGELILTSIDHEGDMNGYDIETLYKVSSSSLIPVIASGGAGKLEDFSELIENSEVSALAAASIYHFTNFTPRDVKIHLKSKNIPVRL